MQYPVWSFLKIDDKLFRLVEATHVQTYDSIAETLTFQLPRKLGFKGSRVPTQTLVRKGLKVECAFGYVVPGSNQVVTTTRFVGWIKEVIEGDENGVTITALNEAYWLDKIFVSANSPSMTIGWALRVIQAAAKKQGIVWPYRSIKQFADANIGTREYRTATARQIFDDLYQTGCYAWSRDGVLYVGLPTVPALIKERPINFARHVSSENGMKLEPGDTPVRVRVVGIKGGVSNSYEVGSSLASEILRTKIGWDYAACKQYGDFLLRKAKQPGYSGEIELYGWPSVNHGDTLPMTDPRTNPKTGTLNISRVASSISSDGIRQACTIHASY